MIPKHKKTLIFSSIFTLFPILVGLLLWNRLPQMMPTHWGADGQVDGWSSLPLAVFGMPMILLAVHWLCVFASIKFSGDSQRNHKMQTLVLWITPLLSNFCCGLMYALALGVDFSITSLMLVFMGVLFAVIGNYLPKCKMNATMGIKIYWTYTSEDNWNATHRFAGKVWVLGGLGVALCALLPGAWAIYGMLIGIAVLVLIPTVYSCLYYRRQKQAGEPLLEPVQNFGKHRKVSAVMALLLVGFLGWILFTGDLEIHYGQSAFTVVADFHEDLTVAYDAIDTIEYRDGNVSGIRVMGFGSPRLLLGTFENEEFGYYTRYTYGKPEACIVITSGEKTLVISSKTASQTWAIYQDLLMFTGME